MAQIIALLMKDTYTSYLSHFVVPSTITSSTMDEILNPLANISKANVVSFHFVALSCHRSEVHFKDICINWNWQCNACNEIQIDVFRMVYMFMFTLYFNSRAK